MELAHLPPDGEDYQQWRASRRRENAKIAAGHLPSLAWRVWHARSLCGGSEGARMCADAIPSDFGRLGDYQCWGGVGARWHGEAVEALERFLKDHKLTVARAAIVFTHATRAAWDVRNKRSQAARLAKIRDAITRGLTIPI